MITTKHTPSSLQWQGRTVPVKLVLRRWSHAGRWWLGEAERHYYLVELANGWTVELYQQEGAWVLFAIQD